MEEVVFKALLFNTKSTKIENFIQKVIATNNDTTITYDDVKESIFKLILYKFIKVKNESSEGNYIFKENNFYKALELGGVNSWLEKQRSYN